MKRKTSTSSFVSKARGDGSGRVTYSLLDDDQKELLFQDFITTYGKTYSEGSDEYNERLLNFKSNLDTADDRNAKESAAGGSGNHGVTKFADLTSGEFLASYLMTENAESRERRLAAIAQAKNIKQSTTSLRSNSNGRLLQSDPTIIFVDWSDSITTEIKNMGKCGGGSWASAAVSQVESDAIKEGIIKVTDPLSVQQILSCTPDQSGCDNGEMQDAFNSIIKPGGIYYNSEYAYTSYAGSVDECVATDSQYALAIGSAFNLNSDNIASNTEALMRMHLTSTGTLAVCLDATIWSTYVSGTLSNCDSNTVNHCAQVVGIYYSSAEDSGFYKIRNSWGTDWGIDGYISLDYGADLCGIAWEPTYTDPVKSGR